MAITSSTNAAEYKAAQIKAQQAAAKSQPQYQSVAAATYVPPTPTYAPVDTTGQTIAPDNSTSNSGPSDPYQAILDQLSKAPQYTPVQYGAYQGPSSTPEQRAAALVNGKYVAQEAALKQSQSKADQDLTVGTATQQNYGQIGDAKLADIYGNLTNIASQTADKTNAIYSQAQQGVNSAYDTAQQTQGAVTKQTNSDIANTANQLGLQSAVADATKNLTAYQQGAASQTAADRADSVANIITLGANQGAAALKDVNIMAQLGADSRRDLVSSVQNTIANLQYQHDQTTADLQSQMTALEAQRASDLQSATYQYQVDDIDQQNKYNVAKAQFDADQAQTAIATQHQNLTDTLSVLKAQQDAIDSQTANTISAATADLQQQKFTSDQNQQDIQNQQALAELGIKSDAQALDYAKFTDQQKQQQFDNYIKQQGADQAYANLTLAQKKEAFTEYDTAIKNGISQQQASTSATQAATAKQNSNTSLLKVINDISTGAVKTATDAQAAGQKSALTAAQITKLAADTTKAEAETAAIKAKSGVSTVKYGKGPAGLNAAVKPLGLTSADIAAANSAYQHATDPSSDSNSFAQQVITNAALHIDPYQYAMSQALANGATPNQLIAIQILFGKA